MANWITHTRIADILLKRDLALDVRGFCVGSIAPDCNIPNEDWSSFDPPRQTTHFMTGDKKTSSDYEAFYKKYILDSCFQSNEHRSFLWGYYAHLVTDSEYMRFIRDPKRVEDTFKRIRRSFSMQKRVEGKAESFDTLKEAFGKGEVFADIVALENAYIRGNTSASFRAVLENIGYFPDYLGIFPEGAYERKIPMMLEEYNQWSSILDRDYMFFTPDEYASFIQKVSSQIYNKIKIGQQ